MKIKDIAAVIESYAPRESAEEWDNVGLMLGDAERECTGVLTCLDCTLDVAKQAKAAGCNLVVTHHPFIFRPVGRLTADTTKGKTAEFLFSNGIAVYSAHTNLDKAEKGLNRTLAALFGGRNASDAGCGCFADINSTTEAPRLYGGGGKGISDCGIFPLLQRNRMLRRAERDDKVRFLRLESSVGAERVSL